MVVDPGGVKKCLLRDKNGKKIKNIGKDDFIPIQEEIFDPLIDYYGLCSTSFDKGKYMQRARGEAQNLYFMGKGVKKLIDLGIQERLTVINSGLKGFNRNSSECKANYRIVQEGVHFVAPHMTKRKFSVSVEDFRACLSTDTIQISTFSDELAETVKTLDMGCFVVQLKGYEDDYIKKLVLTMWKCRGETVTCMVNKNEMEGMQSKLRSIFHEEEPVKAASQQEQPSKEID